jgi:hypothetical protein
MIELFLSSDGKHTIHASAGTPAELAELGPKARALYEKIIENCGNKVPMWQLTIDQEPATLKNARESPPRARNRRCSIPICPIHGRLMRLRQGKYGTFWSCPVHNRDGRWCVVTKEANVHRDEPNTAA